jgi:hypothetical protein
MRLLILLAAMLFSLSSAIAQEATPPKLEGAGILASKLREGDINPGDKYNLEVGSRFHSIHTKYMAIGCQTCHAGVKFPENVQFLRREEFPLAAYPGAVDRSTCLGCHRGKDNMATPFYEASVK